MCALAPVRLLAALTAAALLAACTSQSAGDAVPRSAGSVAAAATPATPSVTLSATPTATPAARVDPVSLDALTRKRYDGRGLRLGRVLARTPDFTRYEASYLSGRLRITDTLHVPTGTGSFP